MTVILVRHTIHYNTFEEDQGHICYKRWVLGVKSDCTEENGFTFDNDGYVLRGCGYNQHCSAKEYYHAGIDYEIPNHKHDPDDYEDGSLKETGLRQGKNHTLGHHDEVDDIEASNEGKVVYLNESTDYGFGKTVILRHLCDLNTPNIQSLCVQESGEWVIYTQYSHMSKIIVSEGDSVSRGQKIGEIGGSGGWIHHLHFEFKTKPVYYCPDNSSYKAYTPDDPTNYGYRNPFLFLGIVRVADSGDSQCPNGASCFTDENGTYHIIHPNYRCSNNKCWSNNNGNTETNCWDGVSWYEIKNGDITDTKSRDRSMCSEVYGQSSSSGSSNGGQDTGSGDGNPTNSDEGYIDPTTNHTHTINKNMLHC